MQTTGGKSPGHLGYALAEVGRGRTTVQVQGLELRDEFGEGVLQILYVAFILTGFLFGQVMGEVLGD